jgi:hypothetical protein
MAAVPRRPLLNPPAPPRGAVVEREHLRSGEQGHVILRSPSGKTLCDVGGGSGAHTWKPSAVRKSASSSNQCSVPKAPMTYRSASRRLPGVARRFLGERRGPKTS